MSVATGTHMKIKSMYSNVCCACIYMFRTTIVKIVEYLKDPKYLDNAVGLCSLIIKLILIIIGGNGGNPPLPPQTKDMEKKLCILLH